MAPTPNPGLTWILSVSKELQPAMPWFVAHNLMVLRPQAPVEQPLLCWENMILLEAEYDSNIWDMAKEHAMNVDASDEYVLTPHYCVPARWEFAGTRKIVTVRQDSDSADLSHGDELTFNTLYIDDQHGIDLFVSAAECDAIVGDETNDPPVRNMNRPNK